MEPKMIAERLSNAQRQVLVDASRKGGSLESIRVDTLTALRRYELVDLVDGGGVRLTPAGDQVAALLQEGISDLTANSWGVKL